MNKEKIKQKVEQSLNELLHHDKFLLEIDANERSIAHRLAVYLEKMFPNWHTDCEYNRNYYEPKSLNIIKRDSDNNLPQDTNVFPDIIIHKRNTDNNLLVIEIKKTTSHESDDYDLRKLKAFKTQLDYKLGLFLKIGTLDQSRIDRKEWC